MRVKAYPCIAAAAFLAGCASSSATFREAEALEAQGKHEEAAAKLDLVCALDPQSEPCPGAGARAAAARLRAAEQAAKDGHWQKAERLYRLALLTADDASANTAKERLASEDLKQGVQYGKAAADPDERRAFETMEAIAATAVPAAEKAKAWIVAKRPGVLVARIGEACRAKPKGSCTQAWAAIDALPEKPVGYEGARAAYEAEQKRVAQPLLVAKRFLDVFKGRHAKEQAYKKCVDTKVNASDETRESPGVAGFGCALEVYGAHAHERYGQEHQDAQAFRKALATIADPALVEALSARRTSALEKGEYEALEPKKPAGGAP